MASEPTIDFDSLLQPISDDSPCGASLKDDPANAPLYYDVKDARETARSAERLLSQAAWNDDEDQMQSATPDKPDWRKVVDLAERALTEKTKDLWIAAWMLEGLTRLHGFAGLRDGFLLIRQLCDRFWDGIHPRPDEDGVATTVAQLTGLNGDGAEGALIAPIAAIRITQGVSVGPFTGQDYTDAEDLERTSDPDVRSKRIEQGVATLAMFETAARETSPEFFAELREDIAAAIEEFDRMTALLDEKCGDDSEGFSAAPPSSKIATKLQECLDRVRTLAGEPVDEQAGGLQEGEEGAVATTGAGLTVGSISAREEAFQALMKVADYFRRTEPHSPVSYALEQAVRWGRMPLPELIRDLVSDDSVRREFFRRTGMSMEQDDD